ncbi:hypothetical protein ASPBRDRAFT_49292 [Aspergillus brasiliensis CBS 101740]|uniref:Uncharacterized protein n=1 Tax=Aspergillus brasiliensis (strain CBS 101740 / IMI 381727 / IBT 21946) TaxID=767769 RepID=A0A1L9U322_ASPBC|nr:hypothetical protein ASPBRDRAFT_49292 [Aspergillus brasiliensis CBS 101740]
MDKFPGDVLRWFGEEHDLDLALDKDPTHSVNSPMKIPHRKLKRPCIRRTLSLNSATFIRQPSFTASHKNHRYSSQSPVTPSFLTNFLIRESKPRPLSSQAQGHHAPQSSSCSIDPGAQYYQDPEARLKLRLYLASPHNFDEAIEFGFPTPADGDTTSSPASSPKQSSKPQNNRRKIHPAVAHIADLCTETDGAISDPVQPSRPLENPISDKAMSLRDTQKPCAVDKGSGKLLDPNNREMTLKMTLTRPDLRTNSWEAVSPDTPVSTGSLSAEGDLQTCTADENMRHKMKTVWCKLRIWK